MFSRMTVARGNPEVTPGGDGFTPGLLPLEVFNQGDLRDVLLDNDAGKRKKSGILGGVTSADEINELARLTYAEGAGQYNVDDAMEGIAWVVRNRTETRGWPGTYHGVIHQKGQFTSVGKPLWNAAGNPSTLTGTAAAAYSRAWNVASGVYNGTIADPTGGAVFFHSGAASSWFGSASGAEGTIMRSVIIDPFTFYRLR